MVSFFTQTTVSLKLKKELLAEATFFQLQGIIDQLEGSKSLFSLTIKNENHYSTLMSWLPPNATCSLLYRASTDGKRPADFHRCCDDKGPTLVVIKSGEYICGGYTSESWESGKYELDSVTIQRTIKNRCTTSYFYQMYNNLHELTELNCRRLSLNL